MLGVSHVAESLPAQHWPPPAGNGPYASGREINQAILEIDKWAKKIKQVWRESGGGRGAGVDSLDMWSGK